MSAQQDDLNRQHKWKLIRKRAGYCGLCCDVLRDFTGHASRRPKCKAHPGSRSLTEEEFARLKAEFDEEDLDPRGAKERRVAAAKQRHAQTWVPPQEPSDEPEYRMNFGK